MPWKRLSRTSQPRAVVHVDPARVAAEGPLDVLPPGGGHAEARAGDRAAVHAGAARRVLVDLDELLAAVDELQPVQAQAPHVRPVVGRVDVHEVVLRAHERHVGDRHVVGEDVDQGARPVVAVEHHPPRVAGGGAQRDPRPVEEQPVVEAAAARSDTSRRPAGWSSSPARRPRSAGAGRPGPASRRSPGRVGADTRRQSLAPTACAGVATSAEDGQRGERDAESGRRLSLGGDSPRAAPTPA